MNDDNKSHISFKCAECGSNDFIFPNKPPKDDDIIKCAGCQRDIGRYDVIQKALTDAAKAEIEKITTKTLGIKPTWKNG